MEGIQEAPLKDPEMQGKSCHPVLYFPGNKCQRLCVYSGRIRQAIRDSMFLGHDGGALRLVFFAGFDHGDEAAKVFAG